MKISIVVPTYCEEENLADHYMACKTAVSEIEETTADLEYEYLVIDNCSPDNTVAVALDLRKGDPNVKIYVNDQNYGPVLSPFHGLMSASGDAVMLIAADLQEPPYLLRSFFNAFQDGYDAAIGYKMGASENIFMWYIRGFYYSVLNIFIDSTVPRRYSGFGLYSRGLIERLRAAPDSEPSLRILVPEYASRIKSVPYVQQERTGGRSSYSLYGYSREAIKTLVRNSRKFPRLAGKLAALLMCAVILLIPAFIALKLLYWQFFGPGIATLIIITLSSNALVLGFLAIVLDKLDRVSSSLTPQRRPVCQSARYE